MRLGFATGLKKLAVRRKHGLLSVSTLTGADAKALEEVTAWRRKSAEEAAFSFLYMAVKASAANDR